MIIIFWRGLGILVPIVWFVIFFFVMVIGNNSGGVEKGKTNVRLFAAVGSILGGLVVSAIGFWLNKQIELFNEKHSFFFIPVEYCGIAIILITIFLTLFVK